MPNYEAFTRYLADAETRSFGLGVWDCLAFAHGAQAALHGRGFAEDWLGIAVAPSGRRRGAAALRRMTGHRTISAALSARLPMVVGQPSRGAVALIETEAYLRFALGVVSGQSALFLTEPRGFRHVPLASCRGFWGA